jgi:glycosyltransferase involved in cell wall biosynthesis
MRFHVLGVPHTVTTKDYSSCAFTQKVLNLCAMLVQEGHEVFHYGHVDSKVSADEQIAVTSDSDLKKSYPGHKWKKSGFPTFAQTDPVYLAFYANTIQALSERKRPGDFLLCTFGDWHRPVALAHPDMIAVESGIGYPNGTFARFKIYESYAILHAYMTNQAAIQSSESHWYDAVIPNAFDAKDFKFNNDPSNYILFLGRLGSHKGLHIATDLAERTQTRLVVAGMGEVAETKYVKPVGLVGPKERAKLLSRARATICASTFLEPFCGVQIESMLSGTPVISSDFGAFAEYNLHGRTGYRCRTFEQFEFAVRNIDNIDRAECRQWAQSFTLDVIGPRYTDYFQSVKDIFGGKGWYEERRSRSTLMQSSNSPPDHH